MRICERNSQKSNLPASLLIGVFRLMVSRIRLCVRDASARRASDNGHFVVSFDRMSSPALTW